MELTLINAKNDLIAPETLVFKVMNIHLFIQKYLFSTYYVPGPIIDVNHRLSYYKVTITFKVS